MGDWYEGETVSLDIREMCERSVEVAWRRWELSGLESLPPPCD